jgi:hypothetical protein
LMLSTARVRQSWLIESHSDEVITWCRACIACERQTF